MLSSFPKMGQGAKPQGSDCKSVVFPLHFAA